MDVCSKMFQHLVGNVLLSFWIWMPHAFVDIQIYAFNIIVAGDYMCRFNEIQSGFFSDAAWTRACFKQEVDFGFRILPFHVVEQVGQSRTEGTKLLFCPIGIHIITEGSTFPHIVGAT